MKKSFLQPEEIEYDVEFLDGEKKTLTLKSITGKQIADLSKIDVTKENAVLEQMAIFFGGNSEDYSDLDVRIIKSILEDVTEAVQNPNKG